ncbi:MAG: hypothetical protein JWO53_1084, partial [Chlamydiia bacterium]|nr:hypothetical protein [Chlamydiia bacterium]
AIAKGGQLTYLNLTSCCNIPSDTVEDIASHSRKIKVLFFWSPSDKVLHTIAKNCPELEKLSVEAGNYTYEGIRELVMCCKKIFSIILRHSTDDAMLNEIGSYCPNLRKLEISSYSKDTAFTEKGIQKIAAGCPQLTDLRLNRQNPLSNVEIGVIATNHPQLHTLHVPIDDKVTGLTLDDLATKCASLKKLRLDSLRRLSIKDISYLKFCKQLTNLCINNGLSDTERDILKSYLNVSMGDFFSSSDLESIPTEEESVNEIQHASSSSSSFSSSSSIVPPENYFRIGQQLYLQGNHALAHIHLEKALEQNPADSKTLSLIGLVLDAQGNQKEARKYYQRALDQNPTDISALTSQGMHLHMEGATAEAKTHFEKAITADPNCSIAHFQLGTLLQQEGSFAAAIPHFEKVLAIDTLFPGAKEALLASQLMNLGKR